MAPKNDATAKTLKSGIGALSAAVVVSLYVIQRDAIAFTPENVEHLFSPMQTQVSVQGLQFSFSALTVLWPLVLAFFVLLDAAARARISEVTLRADDLTVAEGLYLTPWAQRVVVVTVGVALAFHGILFVIATILLSLGSGYAPDGAGPVVLLQGLTTLTGAVVLGLRHRLARGLVANVIVSV